MSDVPWLTSASLGLVLVLAGISGSYFYSFMLDDPYISFRYARNLVDGHGLVFNVGERVEGYTNFLWVLVMAAAMRLGAEPVAASKLLGLLIGGLTVLSVYVVAPYVGCRRHWQRLLPPVILASSSYFGLWSVGGLETGLYTFLVLLALVAFFEATSSRRAAVAGLLFALAAMTRPDAVVFPAAAMLWMAVEYVLAERAARPRMLRHGLVSMSVFVLLFAPYFAWRWAYFGDLLPNTFYAKTGGDPAQRMFGLHYLANYVASKSGLWLVTDDQAAVPRDMQQFFVFPWAAALATAAFALVLALGCLYWFRARIRFAGLLLVGAGVYLAYVAWAGGDWMPGFRFLVPVMPLGALGVGCVVANNPFGRRSRNLARAHAVVAAGLVAGSVVSGLYVENAFLRHQLPWLRPWYDGGALAPSGPHYEVATWLAANAPPDAVVALGEAGIIPFYSGLRTIDLHGLVDRHIARLPGGLHQKSDPAYVLGREPDFMVILALFEPDGTIAWASRPYLDLLNHPEFAERYRLVHEQAGGGEGGLASRFLVYGRRGPGEPGAPRAPAPLSRTEGPALIASPNPVPAWGTVGTTTVQWATGDGSVGQVWVAMDDGGESLFATGAAGAAEAPWIQAGHTYEFRLYAGEGRATLLASARVTGVPAVVQP